MKFIFLLSCCFILHHTIGQKYVLLDKTMSIPPSYSNTVTYMDEHRGLFAIEKDKLPEFLNMIYKLCEILTGKDQPESFNFYVGNSIKFYGIKVTVKREDRMDIVLTSDCVTYKFSMHLCDARLSNSNNSFYIKTWASYIKDNLN
jgi:hypothetical protein